MLKKWYGEAWAGLIWLMIETYGGFMWLRNNTTQLNNWLWIARLTSRGRVSPSPGLCSVQSVSCLSRCRTAAVVLSKCYRLMLQAVTVSDGGWFMT
jgi:hypothetical protein